MVKFKEEFCQLLLDHLREGYTFQSFAAIIGCNPKTLYDWTNRYSDFKEAKERGLQYRSLWWQKKLKERSDFSTQAVLAGLRSSDPTNFQEKKDPHTLQNNVVFQITTGVPRFSSSDSEDTVELDETDFKEVLYADKKKPEEEEQELLL